MILNYYKLASDENYLPKLKVIDSIECHVGYSGLQNIEDLMPTFACLTGAREEHVENLYMITYDHKECINGIHHIASGHVTSVEIPVRVIATHIILSGAYGFKMVHNHPVNVVEPSEDDMDCCLLFEGTAGHLECKYMGHYIISKERCKCIETKETYIFEEDD